ncbi:MAG: DUF177 domain-containing protein [Pyrinomonadaceae bacterium]
MIDMIIELATVGKSPKMITAALAADEIDLDGLAILGGPVELKGEISRDGSRTELRGTVKAIVTLACTRCLEAIDRDLTLEFDDVFVDASEEKTQDEAEIPLDSLNEELLTASEIDLKEVAREQLLLALPEQVFCREDCKGLCPQCGGNRNLIDCNCYQEEIDPRWAALKNLN